MDKVCQGDQDHIAGFKSPCVFGGFGLLTHMTNIGVKIDV